MILTSQRKTLGGTPNDGVARLAVLTVVAAAAKRRRLQEGDAHQDDDGDEGQRDEDVLVDGEQAHLPHALAAW